MIFLVQTILDMNVSFFKLLFFFLEDSFMWQIILLTQYYSIEWGIIFKQLSMYTAIKLLSSLKKTNQLIQP